MSKAIRVKPTDCVEDEEIEKNILENMGLIKEWEGPCKVHDGTAWIMSAGPSLKWAVNNMFRKEYFDDLPQDRILCIKHALPVLADAGIKPFGCVALDPRPISGVSTHGFAREGLYAAAPKETIMFIATMTHPSVTKYLMDNGYRVIGWHAASNQIDKLVKEGKIPPTLAHAGGTCSAMRCLSMSYGMGFRRANMIGFDCSMEEEPEDTQELLPDSPKLPQQDKKKYVHVHNTKDKDHFQFWSTGELIAQAQDIEMSLENKHFSDMEIRFYAMDKGSSYGGSIVETTPNNTIRPTIEERYASN
jgi:hypothetical protein